MNCDTCQIDLEKNKDLFGDLTYDCKFLCANCLKIKETEKSWYCYITRSLTNKYKNHTYNGKTNDPKRRIRQHNGIIKGGAIRTLKTKPNEMYCVIKGFISNVEALQAEWRIKKPNNKRKKPFKYWGIDGRIRGLNTIFEDKQFTSNSQRLLKDMPLTMWLVKDKAHLLTTLPDNIDLIIVDKIDLNNV